MRRRVDIAGVSVEVGAGDAARWDALDALFGGCPDSAESPTIVVEHRVNAPELPDRPADQISGDVEIWLDDDGVSARHRSGTTGRRVGDEIIVGGWTDGVEPVRAFRMAVQPPLMDTLGRHGRHVARRLAGA
jgi:hypothetical protein